jgi:HD-like signal output (HDOD) protein
LEHIPPLSATATELLNVANDPEVDARVLAGIIEKDPQLTARLLGLANSAFFGQPRPVETLEQAIIRVLGLNVVRSLALSLALAGSFDVSKCPAYDLRHYWLMALGTAELSRDLATAMHRPEIINPDVAYLCGLLHSLGEVALVHLRPDLMCAAVHDHADHPGSDLIELERQHLGMDSWQAGEWLAFRWQLPEPVTQTIAFFANGEEAGKYRALVRVVESARVWVEASLKGDVPEVPSDNAGLVEFQRIVAAFRARLGELKSLADAMI